MVTKYIVHKPDGTAHTVWGYFEQALLRCYKPGYYITYGDHVVFRNKGT